MVTKFGQPQGVEPSAAVGQIGVMFVPLLDGVDIGTGGLETLSTYIYADARKGGLTPELRPLSTIIFATVLLLLIIINVRSERAAKKKEALVK